MKVYIVIISYGEYEDYHEYIEKVFDSEEKAIEFKKNFIEQNITGINNNELDVLDDLYDVIIHEIDYDDYMDDPTGMYEKEIEKRFNERTPSLDYHTYVEMSDIKYMCYHEPEIKIMEVE